MESFWKPVSVLDSQFIDLDPISLWLTHKPAGKGELHNCKRLPEEEKHSNSQFQRERRVRRLTEMKKWEKQWDKKMKVRKGEKMSGRLWSGDKQKHRWRGRHWFGLYEKPWLTALDRCEVRAYSCMNGAQSGVEAQRAMTEYWTISRHEPRL